MSEDRAAALRARFDRAFAEPPAPREAAHQDFLRIRVGGAPHAIALADVASLHADLRVVALPTPAPELAGVAAVRSVLVPIYDLRVALGVPVAGARRWTVIGRGMSAGFAFDGFDGHARAPAAAVSGALVTLDGRAHPLVALRALLDGIQRRWKET